MEGKVAGGNWSASEHSYVYYLQYAVVLSCVLDMYKFCLYLNQIIVCIWRLEYRITIQSFNAKILSFAFIIVLLHVFVVSYIHCS